VFRFKGIVLCHGRHANSCSLADAFRLADAPSLRRILSRRIQPRGSPLYTNRGLSVALQHLVLLGSIPPSERPQHPLGKLGSGR
jgi:hypothetical protein